jgi:hypothetical protein
LSVQIEGHRTMLSRPAESYISYTFASAEVCLFAQHV